MTYLRKKLAKVLIVTLVTMTVSIQAVEQEGAHLKLDTKEHAMLLEEGGDEIIIYLATDLETDLGTEGVSLYEKDVFIGKLYDDADLVGHGDDILGDGIYSYRYHNTCTEDITLSFTAKIGDQVSNTLEVSIYTVLSEEELTGIETVDNEIEAIMNAVGFQEQSEANKVAQIEAVLRKMAQIDLVVGESIFSDIDTGMVTFEYTSGVLGGVITRDTQDLCGLYRKRTYKWIE